MDMTCRARRGLSSSETTAGARVPVVLLFPRLAALVIFPVFLLCGCGGGEAEPRHRNFPVMGTFAELKVYAPLDMAEAALDAAAAEIAAVQDACNAYSPDSELSKLNDASSGDAFACRPLLWDVMLESGRFYDLSEGAFDVTAGPLMKLWGFRRHRLELPNPAEIAAAKTRVGLDKVIFDHREETVTKTVPGIEFDLGGIAKGYAVDMAAAAAVANGAESGVINIGGNIKCLPDPPPGKKFYEIGIRDPFNKNGVLGAIKIPGDMAVATSGDYERHVTIGGKRFAHIMNPETGEPVEDSIAVTVVTPAAAAADALSTAVFIKGEDFARRMVELIPGTQIFLIRHTDDGEGVETIAIGDVWSDLSNINERSAKR